MYYIQGKGCSIGTENARKWLEQAANQGHNKAMHCLGTNPFPLLSVLSTLPLFCFFIYIFCLVVLYQSQTLLQLEDTSRDDFLNNFLEQWNIRIPVYSVSDQISGVFLTSLSLFLFLSLYLFCSFLNLSFSEGCYAITISREEHPDVYDIIERPLTNRQPENIQIVSLLPPPLLSSS